MMWGDQQKEEIKTIKERIVKLRLSDADCDRLLKKAGEHGLTVSQLLQNFIGDLVDGTYSNGSDERMFAEDWFNRCWFGLPEDTLLRHLLEYDYDVDNFLTVYDKTQHSKEHPEEYAEERKELAEGEKLWFEEKLEEMLDCLDLVKGKDLAGEIARVREFLAESKEFKGE